VVKEKAVSTTPTPHFSSERAKFEKHQRYQRLIATAKSLERMITAAARRKDVSKVIA
jgi:hypothetical protein